MIRLPLILIGALAVVLALLSAPGILTAQAPAGDPICYMFTPNDDPDTGGTYIEIPCPTTPTETHTPWPTYTPEATATHEPTPTATPTLQATATHTPTAMHTNTPPPDSTPTPELTLPPTQPTTTPTPSPTATIPVPDHKCWGVVRGADNGLFIRVEPWGEIIGAVYTGDYLAFDAKWYQDFWWYRIEWFDDGEPGYISSNYVEFEFSADCSQLEDMTPQGGSNMAIGFFCMPNCNAMEILAAQDVADAKGIPYSVHPYANPNICTQVMDEGGVCSYRPGAPDCPQNIFIDEPRASARAFMDNVRGLAEGVFSDPRFAGKIWIDVVNECGWGDDTRELAWWAEWMDEYITQAAAQNWPPLQLPSLGPGYGDELMFSTWANVLNKLDDHGGLFAMHVYNPVSEWLCPFDEWLADRTLHNWEIMQRYGIDVKMSLTEVGQGWGNTPPNIDDMVCHAERHAGYPFIAQYYVWENGYNFTWKDGNWEGSAVPFIQSLDATAWGQ